METQSVNILGMTHLVVLALWGGVVATEAVVEVYPFRCRELHPAAIRFHFWIDLLVELPLVLAVIATGVTLAITIDLLTPLHLVKIGCGVGAVAINLYCIVVVVQRGRQLQAEPDPEALFARKYFNNFCLAFGLLCAAAAAVMGFRFAPFIMGQ